MMRGVHTKHGTEHILDERQVGGLRGTDKIIFVIKAQALIRGHLARKRIKQRYGFQAKTMGSLGYITNPNYQNPKVHEIKQRLGGFNYQPAPREDGVRRSQRELITLENGAKYEGEWNDSTNERDGRGY